MLWPDFSPHLFLQSEDSLPQLTPEQQRQLELIDMMPLCKETESPSDIPEWDAKTAEEREHLLGKWIDSMIDFGNIFQHNLSS